MLILRFPLQKEALSLRRESSTVRGSQIVVIAIEDVPLILCIPDRKEEIDYLVAFLGASENIRPVLKEAFAKVGRNVVGEVPPGDEEGIPER